MNSSDKVLGVYVLDTPRKAGSIQERKPESEGTQVSRKELLWIISKTPHRLSPAIIDDVTDVFQCTDVSSVSEL